MKKQRVDFDADPKVVSYVFDKIEEAKQNGETYVNIPKKILLTPFLCEFTNEYNVEFYGDDNISIGWDRTIETEQTRFRHLISSEKKRIREQETAISSEIIQEFVDLNEKIRKAISDDKKIFDVPYEYACVIPLLKDVNIEELPDKKGFRFNLEK